MKYSFGSGYKEIRFQQKRNRKSKLLSMIKNNPCKTFIMYSQEEIYNSIIRIEL